jgi:hypothetical protein
MSCIFLNHSSKDEFEAVALRDWLASEGWNNVFLDLDPERGIAAGERWERALHAAANREPLRGGYLPRISELARVRVIGAKVVAV